MEGFVMGRHKEYAERLVAERAAFAGVRSPQVVVLDEELARLGWGVDSGGELASLAKVKAEAEAEAVTVVVEVEESDDAKAARRPKERAVSKPPEKAVDTA